MSGQLEIPFPIGAKVWWSGPKYEETYETCPDCAGTRTIRMALGCGDVVELACATCTCGFDPPRGVVKKTICGYGPREVDLGNVEIYRDEVRYTAAGYTIDARELFTDRAMCEVRCEELRAAKQKDEDRMFLARHKSKRHDMASSVRYWRDQVRRLEEELARARAHVKTIEVKRCG